jgi:hypothetical protein
MQRVFLPLFLFAHPKHTNITFQMKLNFTRIFVALTAIVFCYTACQKNGLKPIATPAKLTTDSVAKQVALNLLHTLTGVNGGVNVNDGIHAPTQIVAGRKGPVLYSFAQGCGAVIDSIFNFTNTVNDQTVNTAGSMHFALTCTNPSQVNGYIVDDTTTVRTNGINKTVTTANSQHFVVQATDNTYRSSNITGQSWDGSINSDTYNGVVKAISLKTNYIYKSTAIILTDKPNLFGLVNYRTVSTNPVTGINYVMTGDIIFLGNDKATVNMDLDYDPNNNGNWIPSGVGGVTYSLNTATGVMVQTGTYQHYDR